MWFVSRNFITVHFVIFHNIVSRRLELLIDQIQYNRKYFLLIKPKGRIMNQHIIIFKHISRYAIPFVFLVFVFSSNIASFFHYCFKPYNDFLYNKSGWRFEYGELLAHRYEIFPSFYEVTITIPLLIAWWCWRKSLKDNEKGNYIKRLKDEYHRGNGKREPKSE
jgi:hypothetical protein